MRLLPLALLAGALLAAAACAGPAAAQSDAVADDVVAVDSLDQLPELIGGVASLRPEYPDRERRLGLQGRVVVQFIVEADGAVSDARVLHGIIPGLDRAAVAAVRRARFQPGRVDGAPVRVQLSLPVNFRLTGAGETRYATVVTSMHSGGRADAAVIGRLNRGTGVAIASCRNGWCRLTIGAVYVAEADLARQPPPDY